MTNNKDILELILTSQVLILSAQIHDEKKREKGTNRSSGNYLREAVKEIHKRRPKVLELLARLHET